MRNLLNILDKDIIVFDKSGRAIFCTDNLLKKVGYTLTEFLESNNVIDITDINFIHNTPRNHKFFLTTNKGYALEQIQKDENISFEETMVFGDFYNDIEMLQKAYYSFVMENANEDMKQYGNFIAKRNRENGVIQAINQYIFKKI